MSEQNTDLQPQFSVEKLYIKDLSLEVPHSPKIFLDIESPEVDLSIVSENQQLEENYYECSVTATVTAKLPDNRVVFLCEATQAGIFRLENIPAEDIDLILGVACPNILYPYVREAISSTIGRAGFPPVLLAPINFESMYAETKARKEAEEAAAK